MERLTERPVIVDISFVNSPGGIEGETSQNGSTYTEPRIFNPGVTDDVGTYGCRAVLDVAEDVSFISPFAIGLLQMQSNELYTLLT